MAQVPGIDSNTGKPIPGYYVDVPDTPSSNPPSSSGPSITTGTPPSAPSSYQEYVNETTGQKIYYDTRTGQAHVGSPDSPVIQEDFRPQNISQTTGRSDRTPGGNVFSDPSVNPPLIRFTNQEGTSYSYAGEDVEVVERVADSPQGVRDYSESRAETYAGLVKYISENPNDTRDFGLRQERIAMLREEAKNLPTVTPLDDGTYSVTLRGEQFRTPKPASGYVNVIGTTPGGYVSAIDERGELRVFPKNEISFDNDKLDTQQELDRLSFQTDNPVNQQRLPYSSNPQQDLNTFPNPKDPTTWKSYNPKDPRIKAAEYADIKTKETLQNIKTLGGRLEYDETAGPLERFTKRFGQGALGVTIVPLVQAGAFTAKLAAVPQKTADDLVAGVNRLPDVPRQVYEGVKTEFGVDPYGTAGEVAAQVLTLAIPVKGGSVGGITKSGSVASKTGAATDAASVAAKAATKGPKVEGIMNTKTELVGKGPTAYEKTTGKAYGFADRDTYLQRIAEGQERIVVDNQGNVPGYGVRNPNLLDNKYIVELGDVTVLARSRQKATNVRTGTRKQDVYDVEDVKVIPKTGPAGTPSSEVIVRGEVLSKDVDVLQRFPRTKGAESEYIVRFQPRSGKEQIYLAKGKSGVLKQKPLLEASTPQGEVRVSNVFTISDITAVKATSQVKRALANFEAGKEVNLGSLPARGVKRGSGVSVSKQTETVLREPQDAPSMPGYKIVSRLEADTASLAKTTDKSPIVAAIDKMEGIRVIKERPVQSFKNPRPVKTPLTPERSLGRFDKIIELQREQVPRVSDPVRAAETAIKGTRPSQIPTQVRQQPMVSSRVMIEENMPATLPGDIAPSTRVARPESAYFSKVGTLYPKTNERVVRIGQTPTQAQIDEAVQARLKDSSQTDELQRLVEKTRNGQRVGRLQSEEAQINVPRQLEQQLQRDMQVTDSQKRVQRINSPGTRTRTFPTRPIEKVPERVVPRIPRGDDGDERMRKRALRLPNWKYFERLNRVSSPRDLLGIRPGRGKK